MAEISKLPESGKCILYTIVVQAQDLRWLSRWDSERVLDQRRDGTSAEGRSNSLKRLWPGHRNVQLRSPVALHNKLGRLNHGARSAQSFDACS